MVQNGIVVLIAYEGKQAVSLRIIFIIHIINSQTQFRKCLVSLLVRVAKITNGLLAEQHSILVIIGRTEDVGFIPIDKAQIMAIVQAESVLFRYFKGNNSRRI